MRHETISRLELRYKYRGRRDGNGDHNCHVCSDAGGLEDFIPSPHDMLRSGNYDMTIRFGSSPNAISRAVLSL